MTFCLISVVQYPVFLIIIISVAVLLVKGSGGVKENSKISLSVCAYNKLCPSNGFNKKGNIMFHVYDHFLVENKQPAICLFNLEK